MLIQYTYTHTCGHLGHGPILRLPAQTTPPTPLPCPQPSTTYSSSPEPIQTITITMRFHCPFCNPNTLHESTPGLGILCILDPQYWVWIKDIALVELQPEDWSLSFEWHGEGQMMRRQEFRHMAWIPRPEGSVSLETIIPLQRTYADVVGGRAEPRGGGHVEADEIHYRTKVRSTWKEDVEVGDMMMRDGAMGSRMAGLMSQFLAAEKSGESAGRYQ